MKKLIALGVIVAAALFLRHVGTTEPPPAPTTAGVSSSPTAPTPTATRSTPARPGTPTETPTGTTSRVTAGDDDEPAPTPTAGPLVERFVTVYLAGADTDHARWMAQLRPLVSDRLYAGLTSVDPTMLPPGPAARVTVAVVTADGGGSYVTQAADGSQFTVVAAGTTDGLRVVDVRPGTP